METVRRRPKKARAGQSADTVCTGSRLSSSSNKRNGTYLTEEEYDEDLAQLDTLLHYVNNLSASLEFLQWEDKRISTDLMPTLLTMYDDLYAKWTSKDPTDASEQETVVCDPSSGSNHSFTSHKHYSSDHSESQMCQEPTFNEYSPAESVSSMRTQETSRPVSCISISSSSSGNSLGLQGGTAYLASSESLDDAEPSASIEAACRRRDRKGIKARREKLRTGSDDSGVQCHTISLPAPPTLKRRYCDPNLSYMDRVVLEIIETEEIYVRDLHQVIEGYLHHWRENPEPAISTEILGNLFSNMEQIYEFNKRFLSDLSQCGTDPVHVARCFVTHNRGFTIYTDYCTNYPRTVSVLTSLMRDEATMHSCRKRQLSLGHTLPLGSYLLKPVQRVLKYHLLLGNIIKHFDKDAEGHADIWDALSAMTGMAHHINDMKRRHEHAVRVQEIQSLLYGWTGEDLTTFGELAAEGAFRIHGCKGVRHVFLFDKMILFAKKKDQNILVYKTHILCSNLMLIESIPGEPLSFHVIPFDNPRLQYTLECRSTEQKREWSQQLKRVILENYSAAIPAHARQLVMELGQTKTNDCANATPSSAETRSRRAHHAPEYLEKRKGKRRVSEIGLVTPKSEPPKNKSQSRSSSCTRDSIRKISLASLAPSEKKQLKFPMWRRKSEPGVAAALSLPNSPSKKKMSVPEKLPVTPQPTDDQPDLIQRKQDRSLSVANDHANGSLDEESTQKGSEGENLHEIVTQLLQHRLEVQKMILNKQRRNITRRKQPYGTSEAEDHENRPNAPPSPPDGSLSASNWTSSTSISTSNYDNLQDVWLKRNTHKPQLYRNHSFKDHGDDKSLIGLPDRPCSVGDFNENFDSGISARGTTATASSDSVAETYNVLEEYLVESNPSHNANKFPNPFKRSLSQPESRMLDPTRTSYECLVDNIHPDHKIYSSHRRSFRKVFSKLTSVKTPKPSPAPSTNDVSKKSSNIVCSVAKHYSKALKERVRQIRTEEDPSKPFVSSPSIGARLANDASEYAVPNVQLDQSKRPDSFFSTASFATNPSSIYDAADIDSTPGSPVENELGDSFYERTFEAIELENELFRDSAIYSDPEDNDLEGPFNCSLSPKNSFKYQWADASPIPTDANINGLPETPRPKKTPPPVPCKPRHKTSLIEQKLRNLETNSMYSPRTISPERFAPLRERKKLLEGTAGVSRRSTVFDERRKQQTSNGWVRHVVGKLQHKSEDLDYAQTEHVDALLV